MGNIILIYDVSDIVDQLRRSVAKRHVLLHSKKVDVVKHWFEFYLDIQLGYAIQPNPKEIRSIPEVSEALKPVPIDLEGMLYLRCLSRPVRLIEDHRHACVELRRDADLILTIKDHLRGQT